MIMLINVKSCLQKGTAVCFVMLLSSCMETKTLESFDFEYSALCDDVKCSEIINPESTALYKQTNLRGEIENNLKKMKALLNAARSEADYQEGFRAYQAAELFYAFHGGPFKVQFSEMTGIPFFGDGKKIDIKGGYLEFSSLIEKEGKKGNSHIYTISDKDHKFIVIVPIDMVSYPIVVLLDANSEARIVLGKSKNFLDVERVFMKTLGG
jgi:hypothetical protein